MQIKRLELLELEAAVMRCVWEHKGISGKEIKEILKEKYGLVYRTSTIHTIIDRLKEKGFAIKRKSTDGIGFYPNIPYEDYKYQVM